ncbi:uncharacterized protein G2W53_018848 [Senna tora]|uniref:Uncharacterized protein n=1 Tax=Senna tora TaxID=362788 RepID=A0A834U197_9FABA|nr:uncharacterized protein G2W53_018848 [Senna tora]
MGDGFGGVEGYGLGLGKWLSFGGGRGGRKGWWVRFGFGSARFGGGRRKGLTVFG